MYDSQKDDRSKDAKGLTKSPFTKRETSCDRANTFCYVRKRKRVWYNDERMHKQRAQKKSRSATLFVWIKRNLFADEIKLQEPDGKREIGGKRKHWLRKWRKKEKKRGKKRKE